MSKARGEMSKVQYIRKKLDDAVVDFNSQADNRFAGKVKVVRIGSQLHVIRIPDDKQG